MADQSGLKNVVDIRPVVAIENDKWKPNEREDTARLLVNPGSVRGENKHTAGQLVHARPYLVSGNRIFVFPVGTEGFKRSGTAGVNVHRNLNQAAVDAHVFHREEGRIILRGTFPGITSVDAMTECISILVSKPPAPGLTLYAPGVFEREQYVVAENWDFDHADDDRTHSITYDISFIRTGVGQKSKDPEGNPAPANPTVRVKPKGKATRFHSVTDSTRTLRAIAAFVYRDADKWTNLISLNTTLLGKLQTQQLNAARNSLPTYSLPTFRFKIGTKVRY